MATQVYDTILAHGTATFMARLVGHMNEAVTRADIESVRYSIYSLRAATRTAVAGHQNKAVPIEAMQTELQTGEPWSKDAVGYNFLHVVPITGNPAFALPSSRYVVDYIFTPKSAEPFVGSFVLETAS